MGVVQNPQHALLPYGKFDPKTMEATVIWCWGPREHHEDVIVTTPTTDLPSLKKPDIIEPSGHIPLHTMKAPRFACLANNLRAVSVSSSTSALSRTPLGS